MKQYLMEGIGTFLLVLLVGLVTVNAREEHLPLAYGAVATALFFTGARVSGGHFNPAISLAELMLGQLERWDFPYYLAAQTVGGVLGAILAVFMTRCSGTADVLPLHHDPFCAFFAEAAGAFALCFVFLNTSADRPEETPPPYSGIAVGFAVMAAVFALGNISPATLNPALALGLAVAGRITWVDIWPSLIGTAVGAAAAASVYRITRNEAG
ncbi:MAG: aquaporin [Saprospiraceae bacterium]